MNNQKTLENIGLSKAETKVYLASLEFGESLHKTLAERAGIKRPTLYEILPKLLEKGLLKETIKGKRKYIVAEDISFYLEEKKGQLDEVQEIVPELRMLLSTAKSKPSIFLYEGVEGIKKVYHDHLLQRKPILEFVGIENIHPELQKYISNYYIPERARRKIDLKMLISGPTKADIFNVRSNSLERREVKTINDESFQIPLGLDIYGDNISITLHRKNSEMIGLIIRSKEIATMMHSIFEFICKQANT